MCPQGNPTSTSYFSFYLWDHGVSYFLSYWVAALFFPFFSFYIIFPTETGAKNKRPQARPRAKESVMIPTLLMNIPTSPKQPNNQTTQYLFANGFGFFCEFFFFVFCSFTAAWNGKAAAYIGIEGRRKESALEVETGQTEGERNQVVTPLALVGSLSRVRPSCWK
jgi:hypothetical protein